MVRTYVHRNADRILEEKKLYKEVMDIVGSVPKVDHEVLQESFRSKGWEIEKEIIPKTTWAKLRPILSHDVEETAYKFTDRQSRGAPLRQVTVILRGWPVAVYFRAAGGASPFWDQMATRFTTINPEMTPEKYREAIRLIAMKKGLPHSVYTAKLGLEEREHAKAYLRESLLELYLQKEYD